jgi:hypothetical protein
MAGFDRYCNNFIKDNVLCNLSTVFYLCVYIWKDREIKNSESLKLMSGNGA